MIHNSSRPVAKMPTPTNILLDVACFGNDFIPLPGFAHNIYIESVIDHWVKPIASVTKYPEDRGILFLFWASNWLAL